MRDPKVRHAHSYHGAHTYLPIHTTHVIFGAENHAVYSTYMHYTTFGLRFKFRIEKLKNIGIRSPISNRSPNGLRSPPSWRT